MSEAWREVARLGKTGERYPHVLADSHGWCLRLGRKDRMDDKFYSSFPTLLNGLIEHFLRRRGGAGEEIRTLIQLRDLVLLHLQEAGALGAELARTMCATARLRPQESTEKGSGGPPSTESAPDSGSVAAASEKGSQAA